MRRRLSRNPVSARLAVVAAAALLVSCDDAPTMPRGYENRVECEIRAGENRARESPLIHPMGE